MGLFGRKASDRVPVRWLGLDAFVLPDVAWVLKSKQNQQELLGVIQRIDGEVRDAFVSKRAYPLPDQLSLVLARMLPWPDLNEGVGLMRKHLLFGYLAAKVDPPPVDTVSKAVHHAVYRHVDGEAMDARCALALSWAPGVGLVLGRTEDPAVGRRAIEMLRDWLAEPAS